jgi:hypothetical protein
VVCWLHRDPGPAMTSSAITAPSKLPTRSQAHRGDTHDPRNERTNWWEWPPSSPRSPTPWSAVSAARPARRQGESRVSTSGQAHWAPRIAKLGGRHPWLGSGSGTTHSKPGLPASMRSTVPARLSRFSRRKPPASVADPKPDDDVVARRVDSESQSIPVSARSLRENHTHVIR